MKTPDRHGAVTLLLMAACVPAIAQPEPRDVEVQKSATTVLQLASTTLAGAQFEITHSDAATGVLQARRVRGPGENREFITCAYAGGSIKDTHNRSTVAVTIAATPNGEGTRVRIATVTTSSYPTLTGLMASPDSETDCASNGTIEQLLLAALSR